MRTAKEAISRFLFLDNDLYKVGWRAGLLAVNPCHGLGDRSLLTVVHQSFRERTNVCGHFDLLDGVLHHRTAIRQDGAVDDTNASVKEPNGSPSDRVLGASWRVRPAPALFSNRACAEPSTSKRFARRHRL